MIEKEIPVQPRKYIRRCVEELRRGLLTFEYLERRVIQPPRKKSMDPKAAAAAAAKKKAQEAAKKKPTEKKE